MSVEVVECRLGEPVAVVRDEIRVKEFGVGERDEVRLSCGRCRGELQDGFTFCPYCAGRVDWGAYWRAR